MSTAHLACHITHTETVAECLNSVRYYHSPHSSLRMSEAVQTLNRSCRRTQLRVHEDHSGCKRKFTGFACRCHGEHRGDVRQVSTGQQRLARSCSNLGDVGDFFCLLPAFFLVVPSGRFVSGSIIRGVLIFVSMLEFVRLIDIYPRMKMFLETVCWRKSLCV